MENLRGALLQLRVVKTSISNGTRKSRPLSDPDYEASKTQRSNLLVFHKGAKEFKHAVLEGARCQSKSELSVVISLQGKERVHP